LSTNMPHHPQHLHSFPTRRSSDLKNMTHEDKPLLDRLLNQNPNLPFWFNTSLGILLTLIGSITIFQLLTTPMPHFPEVIPESMCYPASDLLSPQIGRAHV